MARECQGSVPMRAGSPRRWRRELLVLLAATALAVTGCTAGSEQDEPPSTDPVIAAAGDISCEPGLPVTPLSCQQKATSDLLLQRSLAAVLTLGDEQYVEGRLKNFQTEYGPTWGRLLSITHPAPGNHEYKSGGDGFFQYFGAAAGDPAHPYYSFDLGAWHLIALDSECDYAGGCGKGSPQERWLKADLRAHPARCTLAYWHQPRFSSGGHGNNVTYQVFWTDLYAAGADVVLNGHDHDYERFAPQTPTGAAAADGIGEFVVGTGGKNLRPLHTPKPNSEARSDTFGVLELSLHPGGYDWEFVPIAGSSFTDRGHSDCH
jgi:acid phosphatase type 7